jgi:hypothetical protein
MALSVPGIPWRRGRSPKERHDYYQMISPEQKIDKGEENRFLKMVSPFYSKQ